MKIIQVYILSAKKGKNYIQFLIKDEVEASLKQREKVIVMGDFNAVWNTKEDRNNANTSTKAEIPLLDWLDKNLINTHR